jgi:predicted deacylase
MPQEIIIHGTRIGLGEQVLTRLNISRLPSGTIIDIPVHVFRGAEDGPVVLLLAGMHGDEVNGVEIVRRLLRRKKLQPEKGTVIAIPVLNIYGFLNFSREVPDGKDVNRSFPGNARGSLASRVAAVFVQEILPWVDFGIDFHTGGASRANYPQVRCLLEDAASARLAQAFGAPFQLNAPFRIKSLRKEAAKNGKTIIVYECGESLRLAEAGIRTGMEGALRVLAALGLQKSELPPPAAGRVCQQARWVRAQVAGMFRTRVKLGQYIRKGQLIGSIADPYGEMSFSIKSPFSGYVVGLNHMAVINQGDALMHVGLD